MTSFLLTRHALTTVHHGDVLDIVRAFVPLQALFFQHRQRDAALEVLTCLDGLSHPTFDPTTDDAILCLRRLALAVDHLPQRGDVVHHVIADGPVLGGRVPAVALFGRPIVVDVSHSHGRACLGERDAAGVLLLLVALGLAYVGAIDAVDIIVLSAVDAADGVQVLLLHVGEGRHFDNDYESLMLLTGEVCPKVACCCSLLL